MPTFSPIACHSAICLYGDDMVLYWEHAGTFLKATVDTFVVSKYHSGLTVNWSKFMSTYEVDDVTCRAEC